MSANVFMTDHFEAIFRYATMGIVVTDAGGIITNINSFALAEFGYDREELIGKKIETLIPPRFHHSHVHQREKYTKKPQNRSMGAGLNLFAVRKDGTEFPVEVSLGNYENGGNKYSIAFLTNISIRKKAEEEIENLNNRLEITVEERTKKLTDTMHELERSKEELAISLEKEKELGELKSRFVSMASHEFRTPLSTVLSSAYLIEKYTSAEDQPKRDKHIERIISSVNMLTDILNDFLSVGKIEEGKIQVRFVSFNIEDHVLSVLEEIKNTLKEGQEVIYHHHGDRDVFLDPSLLKHIFMNLVSNASKFSPQNSSIKIETEVTGDRIIISVRDSGIGISPEDQKHLAERFFRATNASNIQGTGLGLHIVSKYAELMNGTVECSSKLNSGTQFTISFIKQFPDEKDTAH